jgi:hypothetical protein
MTLGGLFFLLCFGHWPWLDRLPGQARLFGLGILAGLLHLARADGLLWLFAALVVALNWFWQAWKKDAAAPVFSRWLKLGVSLLVILVGYGLVMSPWYVRNIQVWGSLLPPGGSRAIWITEYEQTMLYPASLLTPQRWLAAGWGAHLSAWWQALTNNVQTALAVQGSILLLPFMLVGMWKLRGCAPVRLGAGMWLLTVGVMTIIFPFAGINGGFFHSGAALQPLLWAAAPAGVEAAMLAYARWRRLAHPQRMINFMSGLLVVAAALLSGLLYFQRVVGASPPVGAGPTGGPEPTAIQWNAGVAHYQAVEQALSSLGAGAGDAVLANNPPGFWLASGRPAVVVPYGGPQMLLAAAQQYRIRYLVLELSNSPELVGLYRAEEDIPQLEYLSSVGTTRLYKINLQK